MTDNDLILDPGVKTTVEDNPVSQAPSRMEALRFSFTDAPRGETDESKAVKAEYLGNIYFDLLQKARQGIDPNKDDSFARAEAVYFSEAMTGQKDVSGKLWQKGGFKTGREYLQKMHDFFLNGGEKNLTKKWKEFDAKPYDQQVAEALGERKTLDFISHAVGSAAESVGDFFNRRGESASLTKEESVGAPDDVLSASKILVENEKYVARSQDARMTNSSVGPTPDAKALEAASKTVSDWRTRQYNEKVRAEYAAKLLSENAWYELSAILPNMTENGRACAKALMDSKDNRLPETMWAKFNALDDKEKELVCRARTCLAPRVEGNVLNTAGDMIVGAMNVASNVLAAPYRFGNKLGMMASNKAWDAGFDVNELARRRQYLWRATGRFDAGSAEGGYLPQMQFEQICQDHGFLAESLIGAVSTLPYMAVAALPGVGVATVAMEAMNEMDDHVALNGGDITDPDYIVSSAIFGALYAYTERLQVEKLLGDVGNLKLRESMLKGFFAGIKDRPAVKAVTVGTISESVQEGLQNGIMQMNEALALDQNALRAFAEGFTQDFVGSLGTMFVVEAGGLVGGHWQRSGFNNGFTEEGRRAGRAHRSADLESIYEADMSKARIIDYSKDMDVRSAQAQATESVRLHEVWAKEGKEGILKEGVDPARAEEWDYYFSSLTKEAKKEYVPNIERAEKAAKDIADFVRDKVSAEFQLTPEEANKALAASFENIAAVRNAWARGAGVAYRMKNGNVIDAGAKEIEKMGFTPEYAARISNLLNYERAAAYSPAALEGIRDAYEKQMGDRVGSVVAMAKQFGGQLVNAGGNTYLKFDRKEGTQLVQIVESSDPVNFEEYEEETAVDVEKATKNRVTRDAWRKMTPDERRDVFAKEELTQNGYFLKSKRQIEIVLPTDPSARITSEQAAQVIGTIHINKSTPTARALNDSSNIFHETYHAFSYFAQASGLWTDKDIETLKAKYGESKSNIETHDEETAAEGFREFLARRASGALTADDEKSPFAKIYAAAAGLEDRTNEKAAQENVATEAEKNFFDQLVADANAIQDEKKEPTKEETKTEPVKETAETHTRPAEPVKETAETYTRPAEPVKETAETYTRPKTWTAFTPTGNVKVSGRWAIYDLAEIVHSNNPLYAIHMRAQLRDRKDNKAEEDTRNDIVNNFQGERLLEAPDTANGAPIVFIDRDENGVQRPFVLSGNGRVLVLNELANRHLYDHYRNVMKKWAAENGISVPEGETPVLVRVIDDFGGSNRDKIADLSNTNSIQQYNEEEQARADAEIIKALDLAKLYKANADGTPDMTPGVNDDFFNAFIRGVGDTSLYNSDRTLTQAARDRAQRALLAIAVGQGKNGRDVVKKLVEQTDTLGMTRQKNAAAIMAAPVAALEKKPAYAIGADVSRAMADYMDFAEKKKAGKTGTFDEYERQEDMLDPRSPIANEIFKLFGSGKPAAAMAEYVKTYCRAAEMEDPNGGLFGAARTREEIWKDAAKTVEETACEKRCLIEKIYTGSAADYDAPSLLHVGTGEGSQVYGWGLYGSAVRDVAKLYSKIKDDEKIAIRPEQINNIIYTLAKDKRIVTYDLPSGAIQFSRPVETKWGVDLDPIGAKFRDDISYNFIDQLVDRAFDSIEDANSFRKNNGLPEKNEHIYEQTFFTNREKGDESHLLKWYETISPENAKRVIAAIESLGISEDNMKSSFGNDWRENVRSRTGQDAYQMVSDCFRHFLDSDNDAKDASALLAENDIDGVKYPVNSFGKTIKDGETAGWNYVSFRDDNIRIDQKWTNGKKQSMKKVMNPEARIEIVDGRSEPNLASLTTKEIKNYLKDKYQGREVRINSDGTLVLFTRNGIESSLKKRGKHRRALHVLDKLIESSHFTDYIENDGQKKHEHINGQYVYTAALELNDGIYSVEIKLDDPKTIENKTFKGQTLKAKIAGATLSIGPRPGGPLPINHAPATLRLGDIAHDSNSIAENENIGQYEGIEAKGRKAITSYAQESVQAAEDALENYVAYFKLSHGSIPRPQTLARIGLSLGMNVVDPKRILKNADRLADRAKGTLIERAAKNGDLGTAMSVLKREKDIEKTVENLIAGGVTLGGKLTHKGVGQVNTLLQKRIDRMMADMNAATLADMEGETGLDLAAEILTNNPDAFDVEYRKAKKTIEEAGKDENQEDWQAGVPDIDIGRELSDSERYKRAELLKEANEKVARFIEEAKTRAEDNKRKTEERRRRIMEIGSAEETKEGQPDTGKTEDPYNPTPTVGKANFKTPGEFAAFLRVWAQNKFAQTHGLTTLGQVEQDRLFGEFYRLCAKQELQDLADKLLAPTDETGKPNAKLAKLGAGSRVWVNRRLAEMEKGLTPDRIERMSADIFAFINKAAIRVSRVDLITSFKAELKERFLEGAEFEELKADTERKLTGWVEEATRYICRVCDLSKQSVNGDSSQLEKEYQRLHEIIDRRQQVYDESGKEVAAAAQEDAETLKAQWMLALLDKYGAMRSLMPGEILDLQNDAFDYLENEAKKLEDNWKETREEQEQVRKDYSAAIVGPNGQKYESKGPFAFFERLFDGLNGLIRLRMKHLTRFATEAEKEKANAAINSILVRLGDGETDFARALQTDRDNLFAGLANIFQKDGKADNAAIKRYLERMDEKIPAELARQISNQGYAESMTYGQMLQLLVSLEQRSFKNAIEANGREGQAELIRSFTYADEEGRRVHAFTREDDAFVDFLRAFYAAKRDDLSEVTMRMVGHKVDSPDPLYCPVRRWIDDKARALHADPTQRWDPISKIFSRRIESDRDFDESRTILGLFYENSRESAKLTAWAERGSFIRNVVTSPGFQACVKRAFGPGELGKILKQLEATFNGGEVMKETPAELAAVDKALNFTTYAYLGFNPLSAAKQTTSFTVWANALPGGFKDLWRHMTHFDKDVVKHLKESEEYKVRYGNDVGSGQDMATKGLNSNPSSNPFMRTISGAGMWLLKKGDFAPGIWIAQGVYKDLLNQHLKEGMNAADADKRAITETFNMLEETQQSGRTYNTNMLTIEHGRIGRLLTQFATSPLQQLQYETQALREWRDMVKYRQGEEKVSAARQKFFRAALINHVLLPAALNLVITMYKAAMGEEPPWEKDGYHWTLLTEVLMGQFSRVFFLGAFADTTLRALFKRETPRAGQLLPVEGMLGMGVSAGILVHDLATMNVDNIQKDLERAIKGAAPTRIPYNVYRRLTGDADVDRKAKKKKAKRK